MNYLEGQHADERGAIASHHTCLVYGRKVALRDVLDVLKDDPTAVPSYMCDAMGLTFGNSFADLAELLRRRLP